MKGYEFDETELVKKFVKKGDLVLDLGANIGHYTILMSKLVGNKGKVFSFEPEIESFKLLKSNAIKCKNVVVEKKGVFNRNGKKILYKRDNNSYGSTLHKFKRMKRFIFKKRKFEEINTIKLDDYFKDEKIDFIKIDVEGSEFKALRGMMNLIKRSGNMKMITEFYPELINKVEKKKCAIKYLELLRELGFKLYFINGKIPVSNEKIMNKCKKLEYVNLFCKKIK